MDLTEKTITLSILGGVGSVLSAATVQVFLKSNYTLGSTVHTYQSSSTIPSLPPHLVVTCCCQEWSFTSNISTLTLLVRQLMQPGNQDVTTKLSGPDYFPVTHALSAA